MAIYYFDSSALVKRYQEEEGSARVNALIESAEQLLIARLAIVEVSAALTRRARFTRIRAHELVATLAAFDRDATRSLRVIDWMNRFWKTPLYWLVNTRCAPPMPSNWLARCFCPVIFYPLIFVLSRPTMNSTPPRRPRGCWWKIQIRIEQESGFIVFAIFAISRLIGRIGDAKPIPDKTLSSEAP